MDVNKQKALDIAIKQIDKAFGKGTLMRLGDKEFEPIECISTGSLGLDMALGIGGIPQGRIIEIYGPESSGKTTLALQTIASAQKKDMVCAFIDAEHALDVVYAKNLGVDTDNLLVSQPDFGEQALDVLETLTRSGAVDLIVVDSVAALTPKTEIEGDMGDTHVCGSAGQTNVSSPQKTHCYFAQDKYNCYLHKPNSYEDRHHGVW